MSLDNNTIVLIGDLHKRHEEYTASGIVKPGYLGQIDGDGKILAHSVYGGGGECIVCKEDALQGKTIDDAYAVGDLVFAHHGQKSDVLAFVLKAGQNVDDGDKLMSAGDGTMVKYTSPVLANVVAQSTAITNLTAETTFSNGTITIPANTLKAGDNIRIRGRVAFPTTNSTDTALIKLKIGSTVIFATAATDVADADACVFDVLLTVRTVGASGTLVATGTFSIGVPGTATTRSISLVSTAIDTTAAASITVTCTWSVASTSNIAYLQQLAADLVNDAGQPARVAFAVVKGAKDLSLETDPDFVKGRVI
jgi:hypothetical protein